jgi:trk system potassium uptake protein
VIRPRQFPNILGIFLLILAGSMLLPLGVATVGGDSGLIPIALAILATGVSGGLLTYFSPRRTGELSIREGLLVVAAVWIAVALFGSLPFFFSTHFETFVDAFFESTSGFTTTGATVLGDVAVLPASLHFWRCFSQWVGGMGIVVLGVAILPLLGVGGMHLYRAEFSGARSERLTPRIAETATALWKIYFALTLAQYVALRLAGMGSFDAVLHSFSTLGTGGFSNRTASIAAFNSPAIEYIIIVFMVLGGANFTAQYRLWVERQPSKFFRDLEIRAYAGLIGAATLVITISIVAENDYAWTEGLRAALFQVTSIMTSTGFITADYERWSPLPQLILLALMFAGGCTGSTAGGLKIARMLVLAKSVSRDFKRMVHRHGVFAVRLGDQVIPDHAVQSVLSTFYLAFIINFVSCLLVAATGVDVLTSISAVAACMFNIGPALGAVGPLDHYGHLPIFAKWVLALCMLAGRLEFFTALVIFTPAFWRK